MVCAHIRQDQAPPPHHSDVLGMSACKKTKFHTIRILKKKTSSEIGGKSNFKYNFKKALANLCYCIPRASNISIVFHYK